MRARQDRGAATVLVTACLGVLLLIGCALAVVAAMVTAHRSAQAAADLAALAGAIAARDGGDPCAAARAVAAANGAALTGCSPDGAEITVEVEVAGPRWLGQVHDLTAAARAGPADVRGGLSADWPGRATRIIRTGTGDSMNRLSGASVPGGFGPYRLDFYSSDPGDGSEAFDFPWVTSAEQAEEECSYSYEQASNDGTTTWNGRPAHLASVTAVWTLSFEINGTPVTIPNAPATLTSDASTAPVRVDEQGAVVTDVG